MFGCVVKHQLTRFRLIKLVLKLERHAIKVVVIRQHNVGTRFVPHYVVIKGVFVVSIHHVTTDENHLG